MVTSNQNHQIIPIKISSKYSKNYKKKRLDSNIESQSSNNTSIYLKLPFFEVDVTTKFRDSMIFKFYLFI